MFYVRRMDYAISWLFSYTVKALHLDAQLSKYIRHHQDQRQWVGMAEAVIALSYNRFRPGAKLKINGFKITNDHKRQIVIMSNTFDLQGVKRKIMGGKSSDMLNLKSPIYYSYMVLSGLTEDERSILLTLASESIHVMLTETYLTDLTAHDLLKGLQLVIKKLQENPFKEDKMLEEYLCIKSEYVEHPLTVYNLKLWREDILKLKDICKEFKEARVKFFNGGDYEPHLVHVRKITEEMRLKMMNYWEDLSHV